MSAPDMRIDECIAAVGKWAALSAESGRHRNLEPEVIEAMLGHVLALEAVVEFYAREENWTTTSLEDYRRSHGEEPVSEARVGRMRLVAPGRALPAVMRDAGFRARAVLAGSAGPEAV